MLQNIRRRQLLGNRVAVIGISCPPPQTSTPQLLQLACLCSGIQWLNVPDAIRILIDAPVTTEEAHPRHRGDASRDPFILVAVRLVDELLRLDVAVKVI